MTLRRLEFDPKEEDFYNAIYTQSQSEFSTYVQSETVLNNYAHIFDLLIRLRQAVNHPYLVVHSASANMRAAADAASKGMLRHDSYHDDDGTGEAAMEVDTPCGAPSSFHLHMDCFRG